MATILIADDAEVFRRLEEGLLRAYGHTFLHAKDGIEAIACATRESPDLILLDVQMPRMDGVQVLRKLRTMDQTKDIPIIIVTTLGREHDEELLRGAGASDFIAKPIHSSTFTRVVQKHLR